jgi:hypothetical protein
MVPASSFCFNQIAAMDTVARDTAAATAMINTGRLFIMYFQFLIA